jgi:hypothetical protein
VVTRQVRVIRDARGDLLVIELLLVRIEGGAGDTLVLGEPLPLVKLQDLATEVRGLGGDVAPDQVSFNARRVEVVGPTHGREFQVAFAYRLPSDVAAVELVAEAPVAELIVEVSRGTVEARPDPSLAADGEGGPEARPYLRYVARHVPPDSAVTIEIVHPGVDWRQRLAVLLATALAASAAGVYVWRRAGRPAPRA